MIPDNTFDVTRGFMINNVLVHNGGAYVCIDNTPSRAVWKYRSKSIKEDYGSLNVITQSDWNQTNNTQVDYIKNKPTEFPPSAHTHSDTEVNLTETYTGNLAGVSTQKDANYILDALVGGVSGIKYIINSDETLVIEQDYEYNVTQLYVDGVIECNGVINLIS